MYYRAAQGFGASTGVCTPVDYTDSSGAPSIGNLCVDQSGVCGDAFALQSALNALGYGPVPVTGSIGPETNAALARYAKAHGIPYPGSLAGPELCEPMVKEYGAGSTGTSTTPTQPTIARKIMSTSAGLRTAAASKGVASTTKFGAPASVAPGAPGSAADTTPVAPASTSWWGGLPTWEKYAIVGGGVAVVGAIAYYLTVLKPKNAVANKKRRRMHRNSQQRLRIGHRVELHPGTDRWMMGDRFGRVEKFDKRGVMVYVRLDKSGKLLKFRERDLNIVD